MPKVHKRNIDGSFWSSKIQSKLDDCSDNRIIFFLSENESISESGHSKSGPFFDNIDEDIDFVDPSNLQHLVYSPSSIMQWLVFINDDYDDETIDAGIDSWWFYH